MIRIRQLKLPVEHSREELTKKAARALRVKPEDISRIHIERQSLDARKKPELFYTYTVDVEVKHETQVLKRAAGPQILKAPEERYQFPQMGEEPLSHRPVIVGMGPAGLFCGLMLARAGFKPLILERGGPVEERRMKVERFWTGGGLDLKSNVQFGEGGAGTFSDGKLNTLVKDVTGRNRKVMELLVEAGADSEILYQQKPHIGTDRLSQVVACIREEILALGGEVRFNTQVTDFIMEQGRITGLVAGGTEQMEAEAVVLAVGHSARDTFETLLARNIYM